MAGMMMCRPLPERGGPISRIESSTLAHTPCPFDVPSRYPTSLNPSSVNDDHVREHHRHLLSLGMTVVQDGKLGHLLDSCGETAAGIEQLQFARVELVLDDERTVLDSPQPLTHPKVRQQRLLGAGQPERGGGGTGLIGLLAVEDPRLRICQ